MEIRLQVRFIGFPRRQWPGFWGGPGNALHVFCRFASLSWLSTLLRRREGLGPSGGAAADVCLWPGPQPGCRRGLSQLTLSSALRALSPRLGEVAELTFSYPVRNQGE